MYQFLTADAHFNHKNIIKYCNRPFKDTKHMNEVIIRNINSRCTKEDTLFHLGDFMFGKSTQADIAHKEPELLLNPKVIHIRGNHDRNNNIKGMLDFGMLSYANTKYLLCHVPPTSDGFKNQQYDLSWIYTHIDCILCGHVHGAWKTNTHNLMIGDLLMKTIPIINVGVDVWNFMPVRIDEVDNLYKRLRRELNESESRIHSDSHI